MIQKVKKGVLITRVPYQSLLIPLKLFYTGKNGRYSDIPAGTLCAWTSFLPQAELSFVEQDFAAEL